MAAAAASPPCAIRASKEVIPPPGGYSRVMQPYLLAAVILATQSSQRNCTPLRARMGSRSANPRQVGGSSQPPAVELRIEQPGTANPKSLPAAVQRQAGAIRNPQSRSGLSPFTVHGELDQASAGIRLPAGP